MRSFEYNMNEIAGFKQKETSAIPSPLAKKEKNLAAEQQLVRFYL